MTVRRVLFFFLFIFLLYSLSKNIFEYKKNYDFYLSFKNEYEREKRKNTNLKTQTIKNADPHEIEKTIRNKLNLSKPNEMTVILANPTPTPTVFTPTPPPNYIQWWNVFFK